MKINRIIYSILPPYIPRLLSGILVCVIKVLSTHLLFFKNCPKDETFDIYLLYNYYIFLCQFSSNITIQFSITLNH